MLLNVKTTLTVIPKSPFHFDFTVHNPGHFPTLTEYWEHDKYWQPMRMFGKVYGIKLENKGSVNKPKIRLTLFSKQKPTKKEIQEIVNELDYRFEFQKNISEFTKKFKNDKILEPVIKRRKGMRFKCSYSLYESLMIYIVLQNATVRRSVQMAENLLKNYGTKVKFDEKELYVFWTPKKLNKVSEQELRELKVGYRAKFFKRITGNFVKGEFNEFELRKLDNEELKKKLLDLYGIGPASVGYLLNEVFHRHNVFDNISPWEQKIYSRLIFNKELVSEKRLLNWIDKNWGEWKALASSYIFTDLFWRHKDKKIDWLEKEIRL